MDAYAQGINHHVDMRLVMPIDFYLSGVKWQPWTVEHTFLTGKLLEWSMSITGMEELARSNLLLKMSPEEA